MKTMNKVLCFLLTVFTGLIIAGGCSGKKSADSLVLTASPGEITSTADSGSYSITVICGTAWTATSNAEWCTVTFVEGDSIITAKVAENPATESRATTITIVADTLAYIVAVNQAMRKKIIEFTFTGDAVRFYATAKSIVVDGGDGSINE
jgi:hypothetical protein